MSEHSDDDGQRQPLFLGGEAVETCRQYDEAPEAWRCSICWRNKAGIIRRTKTGRLKAFIVIHHDHFRDHAARELMDAADALAPDRRAHAYATFRRTIDYLTAFPHVAICEECNHAEAKAKKAVGAPAEFSFGPIPMWKIMRGGLFNAGEAKRLWRGGYERMLEMRRYRLATIKRLSPFGCPWHEPAPISDSADGWAELFAMLNCELDSIPNPYRMSRK